MVRGNVIVGVVLLALAGCPGFRLIHVIPECESAEGCPEDGGAGGGSDGGSDGGSTGQDGGGASSGPFNRIFVTRGSYAPGTLGDGDGGVPLADAVCSSDATLNGYAGHFIALLSTSKHDVKDRVPPGIRGWTFGSGALDDPQPFVDQLGEPWFFERLEDNSLPFTKVATGSTAWGTFHGPACDDWTSSSPATSYRVGDSARWFPGWADDSTRTCDTPARLYCLQIDYQAPLPRAATPGILRAFVTRDLYAPGRGLAGFDADCAKEAAAAGLGGQFQAYLATESQSAELRVWNLPGSYHRLDGVRVGTSNQFLGAAPLNVTADLHLLVADGGSWPTSAALLPTDTAMWTGAWDEQTSGTSSTCTDWLSTSGTGYVRDAADVIWGRTERSCAGAAHLACVEVR